jgi:hypothetical protein
MMPWSGKRSRGPRLVMHSGSIVRRRPMNALADGWRSAAVAGGVVSISSNTPKVDSGLQNELRDIIVISLRFGWTVSRQGGIHPNRLQLL